MSGCSFKSIVSSENSMKLFAGYCPLGWILRGCYDSLVLSWEVFVQLGTLTCRLTLPDCNSWIHSRIPPGRGHIQRYKIQTWRTSEKLWLVKTHIFFQDSESKHWTAPIIYYNTFWIISNPCCIRTELSYFLTTEKMLATRKNCYFT